MDAILITIFAMAYAAIALEHPLKVNKSASALLGAGLLWTVYAVQGNSDVGGEELSESLSQIAQIIFFLMGAMTIVEVIDAHNGFALVTSRIRTTKLARLLWIVGLLTFFISAVLDNLTTTIIMVSLVKKLLRDRADRLFFAGIIVIAANAGGAWSPIGDVTTTMLWIGGQITANQIIGRIFVPALFNLLVPLAVTSWALRGRLVIPPEARTEVSNGWNTTPFEQNTIFFMGIAALLTVPVFKAMTHLPPFMGILLNLGILWLAGELIHRRKSVDEKEHLVLAKALQRIDMSSLVFFLGILLAVAVLEHAHMLAALASWLDAAIGRPDIIVILIGIASAVMDNVPLVAATMGMYPLEAYPTDSFLWEFLAYGAGADRLFLVRQKNRGPGAPRIPCRYECIFTPVSLSPLGLVGPVPTS